MDHLELQQPLSRHPLPAIDAAYDPTTFGEDLDEPTWTPLQLASRRGSATEVKRLLDSDKPAVNDQPRGYYGQTALQAASIQGHEDVVELLLKAGADVHYAGGNNMQRTALQFACGQGNIRVVNLLLDYDSQVNMSYPASGAKGGRASLQVTRYNGRTALQAASERGHESIAKKLINMGASVNAPPSPSHGRTALQAASENGFIEIVELLLNCGADVNASAARYQGLTALQAASLNGHIQIITLLVEAGANLHAEGGAKCDGTPLHAAAEGGQVEAVRRLIELGAQVNAVSSRNHQTPRQAAVRRGQGSVVRELDQHPLE